MTVTVVPDTGNHLAGYFNPTDNQGGIYRGGHVLVTEFLGMALNLLFCADVLRPLHLVPSLTLPTNTTLLTTQ